MSFVSTESNLFIEEVSWRCEKVHEMRSVLSIVFATFLLSLATYSHYRQARDKGQLDTCILFSNPYILASIIDSVEIQTNNRVLLTVIQYDHEIIFSRD